MIRSLIVLSCIYTAFQSHSYAATECPQVVQPTYDPIEFKGFVAGACIWRRPSNVQFVLIKACGAGGGGGNTGDTFVSIPGIGSGPTPGSGGGSGPIRTEIVGPLTQDEYQIAVGEGGKPGKDGGNTVFLGGDAKVTFAGGRARAAVGATSPYAKGGAPSAVSVDGLPLYGGGDAGLEDGGNGSVMHRNSLSAATSGGTCAGGGVGYTYGRERTEAGSGGDGYLLIVPLAAPIL